MFGGFSFAQPPFGYAATLGGVIQLAPPHTFTGITATRLAIAGAVGSFARFESTTASYMRVRGQAI